VALALVIFASLFAGTSAQAKDHDIEWCAEDPVIVVFGNQFKVVTTVQAPEASVSGFAYVVDVPSNAAGHTSVAYPHEKYASTTVQVRYSLPAWDGSGSFGVSGTVKVTATGDPAVSVSWSGPAAAAGSNGGSASSAVSFATTISPAADKSGANQ
jgi:hypothetical protein